MPLLSPTRLRWQRPTIAPTLALVFVGTVTMATLVSGGFVLRSSLNLANQNTARRLRDVTRLVASRLDADALSALRSPQQMRSSAYREAHAELVRALDQIDGVRYIYTLRKAPPPIKDAFSRYVFVVDGTPYDDADFTSIGVVMPTSNSTDALHRVWVSGRFEADANFVRDQWGTWLSGYLPLRRRNGSFETVLGIDISARNVLEERQRILRNLGQAYLLSLLLTLPLSVLVGNQLTTPLRVIHRRLQALALLTDAESRQRRSSGEWIQEIFDINQSVLRLQAVLAEITRLVPPPLLRKLVLNRDVPAPRVESRQLALLFTRLATPIDPLGLQFFNDVLAIFSDAATSTRGVFKHNTGDSALLFWGAPDQIFQPARVCLEAAFHCCERFDDLARQWHHQGQQPPQAPSFGLDFGSVLVGLIGPEQQLSYTVVGDRLSAVQTLTASNACTGSRVLASADFVAALGDAAADFLILPLLPPGSSAASPPQRLYEVVARRADAGPEALQYSVQLLRAQNLLQAGDLEQARLALLAIPAPFQQRPYLQEWLRSCGP